MRVRLYTPHTGQLALHDCRARFRVMACGRRFGKTLAATNELAKAALEKPSSLNWWVAPTYRQTEIAFELLIDALQPVMKKEPNHTKMRIDLINNSVIECRSADRYENMRGDGPSFVVFDEASKCPKAAWQEVVRPALMDNNGKAIFISTPWGRDWFWELFQRGQDDSQPDWWSQSFPTSANPFIPAEEIEEARRTTPQAIFDQEYMAVFNDDASSVFRGVDRNIREGGYIEPALGHFYVIGWDIAKYQDYSVFTVLDCNTRDIVYWQRLNGLEYRIQIDSYLVPLVQRYNGAHVVMDITGVGDPLLDEVRRRDIGCEGFYFTNSSKKQLIDGCVVAVEQGRITYPLLPTMIDELKAYSYEFTASKNVIYSAPEGQHDDCVISLALAVFGAQLGGDIPMTVTRREEQSLLPQAIIVDEYANAAFLAERQRIMQQNLKILGTNAAYQNVTKIAPDSSWGIA